jgi:2-dehydro-3-deoxygalactonokinase
VALDDTCVLFIDGGTTRTRGWAVVGEEIIATARVTVGARDTAREGSSRRLSETVRHLVHDIEERCGARRRPAPALAVAAGMITSAEGLAEVPHVEAPAGVRELARAARCHTLSELGSVPIVLVPGIRTGPARADPETIGASDIMRGEEALSLGLAVRGHLSGGGVVLSLGSHWKAIHVDASGRVAFSVSTLSGEMLQAVRTRSILATAVPPGWPSTLPPDWLAAGAGRARADGWPRALYCVRLLHQRTSSSPEDRLAFMVGATIVASEDVLLPAGTPEASRVVLVGAPILAEAWARVLRERGLDPAPIDEEEKDAAFRAGCRAVLAAGELIDRGAAGPGVEWRPPPLLHEAPRPFRES